MMRASVHRFLISSGMVHSLGNQLLVSGFSFLIGIAAARLLGISDFGLFTLIFMISQMFVIVESDLLTTPMMTLAGSKPKLSKHYFGSIALLSALLSSASGLLMAGFVAVYFSAQGTTAPTELLISVAFFTFAQNVQIISRRILFAIRSFTFALSMEALRVGLVLLFAGLWFASGAEASVSLLLAILGTAAFVPVLLVWALRQAPNFKPRLIRAIVSRHWPISRWFLLVMLVSIFQEQAIWVMVGIHVGDAGVGALRAGQYLLGMTHVVIHALENFLPRAAAERLRTGDAGSLATYLSQQLLVVGGLSLLIIVGLTLFAEEVLVLVFGAEFGQFAHLLRLFSIVYLIVLLRGMFKHYLRAIEDIRSIFLAFLASSIVAVATIQPALVSYGIEGAVYCMIAAQIVCLLMMTAAATRHYLSGRADHKAADGALLLGGGSGK